MGACGVDLERDYMLLSRCDIGEQEELRAGETCFISIDHTESEGFPLSEREVIVLRGV